MPVLLAVVAAALVLPAHAQSTDTTAKKKPLGFLTDTVKRFGLVPQHFTIGIGGYLPSVSSSVQLSSPTLSGDNIDLENRLGLHRSTQSIEALATLRLGSKQLITLGYFGFRRSADKTLTDSITFGDTTYHANAMVAANSSIQYYGFTYRFYFLHRTRHRRTGPQRRLEAPGERRRRRGRERPAQWWLHRARADDRHLR
jgi:hypothetical protein